MKVLLYTVGLSLCLFPGCRPTVPVEEVSVAESGVVVAERASDLTTSWPQWRGPNGDGHASAQDLPTQWSETENIRWQTKVPGRGHGSPMIVGDLVLLATADDANERQLVLAFDRASGEKQWETVVHEGNFPARGELHKKGTNANSTLASDGERVFATFLNGGKIFATALDLQGEQLWQREIGAFDSKFGFAPSPVLYESLVIVAADNRGGGYIAGLDGATGEIAWRVARPAKASYSSPGLFQLDGRDQLVISGCNRITSYNPATGDELWSTNLGPEATCGTIVAAVDRLFASGGYPERETHCLSGTGEVIWSNNSRIYEPSMLVVDENLYAVSDDGIARCWSITDGKQQWQKRLDGGFSASPIVCDGLIYVSNLAGKTFVFNATGESYQEVATNQVGDDCYTSAAAVDGQLFLRIGRGTDHEREEFLVCIADDSGE